MTKLTLLTTKEYVSKKRKGLSNPLDYSHYKMEMNWDYIAGFFDGEGSVTLYKETKNKWGRAVKINIEQKDTKSLKAIKKFLLENGLNKVGLYSRKTRTTSCIQIQNKFDIALFLENIIPLIIVKRKKSIKCLKFVTSKWYAVGHYSKEEKQKAINLYKEGKNYFEISKIIGANHKTIKSWVNK